MTIDRTALADRIWEMDVVGGLSLEHRGYLVSLLRTPAPSEDRVDATAPAGIDLAIAGDVPLKSDLGSRLPRDDLDLLMDFAARVARRSRLATIERLRQRFKDEALSGFLDLFDEPDEILLQSETAPSAPSGDIVEQQIVRTILKGMTGWSDKVVDAWLRDCSLEDPREYKLIEAATKSAKAVLSLPVISAALAGQRELGETIQTLLDLLNPLHGSLDQQTYDERYKEGFDAPRDAEYTVNVTAQQERDLTQAVLILENRRAALKAAGA